MGSKNTNTGAAKVATPAAQPIKHIVTQEDLDNNPELAQNGVKVGDEIELPAKDDTKAESKPKAQPKPKVVPEATITVDGKNVRVKFGVHIPMMGDYTKEQLLEDAEAVAYLLEQGSGAVEIVEPTK